MDDKNIVIDVSDVTVRFNRASQQVNNLKEYVIKMVKKRTDVSGIPCPTECKPSGSERGSMGNRRNEWFRKIHIVKADLWYLKTV